MMYYTTWILLVQDYFNNLHYIIFQFLRGLFAAQNNHAWLT